MKKCKLAHECADNAKACPICGHRFTGLVTKIVAGWFILAFIIVLVASLSTTHESASQTQATSRSDGQVEALISRCGMPSKDESSENENPRPIIMTRILDYRKANVRFIFFPDSAPDSPPPYRWKLSLMSDLKGKGLTAKDVRRRLPCMAE